MTDDDRPRLLRRALQGGEVAPGVTCLAAVAEAQGLRAFFAQNTPREAFASQDGLQDISGALAFHGAEPPFQAIRLHAQPPERAIFTRQNLLLAFRLSEPSETVLDWLAYHARHHGATAALIVNRADPAKDPHRPFEDALELGLATRGLAMKVMTLSPGLPLGRPDHGPETHPFLAPDAPGKDRMTPPEPDPWLSPLGENAFLEALKWIWLAEARAVLLLDPCDYLEPLAEGTVDPFTLCTTARHGVILMIGRRIYPWRVRKGERARLEDHICRQFDARRGLARWGCAPTKAGLDRTWRMVRLAYAKPDEGVTVPFWRAMAIRVPDRTSGELAPKSSLVEDTRLLATFAPSGWRPVRAPASQARKQTPQGQRTAIVTTMKNEGPFILEWLAWHRAIGVQDFLIYTNDCTDGTVELLDLLMRKGLVEHRANPWVPGGELKPQHAALQAAEAEPVIAEADWAICMDVDEFINIKIGDGRLPTLYAAMEAALPGANMISLTWRLYGNAHIADYEDRFITQQFTLCAPKMMRKPHQAWGFKTLFRNNALYKKMGVHRPKGLKPDLWQQIAWLNGSGQQMPREMLRNGWRSTLETYGYDWVQLNHYALRSAESFLVKRDRGRVNHVDRDQGLHYWFRMNHNVVSDPSITQRLPMLQAEWERLLSDPEIAAAHTFCVKAHRAKIAELRSTPTYEAFYAELTGARLQSLSQKTPHFGSSVFNEGPQVVPDEIALAQALPQDFYFTVDASEID